MKILIKNKKFRYLAISDFISSFGDGLYALALITYASSLKDPFAITLVSVFGTLPLVLQVFTGAYSDRSIHKMRNNIIVNIINIIIFIIIAITINFDHTFRILGIILILNLISDIIQHYSNGLSLNIFMNVVKSDDISEAKGLQLSLSRIAYILSNSIGALILTYTTYSYLAYINSATYFIAAIILIALFFKYRKFFNDIENADKNEILTYNKKNSTFKQIFNSMKFILNNKIILKMSLIIICMNIIGALLIGSISILLTLRPQYNIINISTSLAILYIIHSFATIIGNLLVGYLNRINLKTIFIIEIIFTIGLYIVMLLMYTNIFNHLMIYLYLLMAILTSILFGIASPKAISFILNTISKNNIATTMWGFGSLITLLIPISQLLILGSASYFNFYITLSIIFIICFIVLIISILY